VFYDEMRCIFLFVCINKKKSKKIKEKSVAYKENRYESEIGKANDKLRRATDYFGNCGDRW
jgi:hypothetical protein